MELRYPHKDNGMFILNRNQIDDIATMVHKEYMPHVLEHAQPVDIDAFAVDGLFLDVQNKTLGYTGGVLGVTAFGDEIIPCLDDMYRPSEMKVSEGMVLIHTWLAGYANRARRRFTLAHECSHWILHRTYHSPDNKQYTFRTQKPLLIACRSDNIEKKRHDLKTDEDWEEWQADTLAASLLMPLVPFQWAADRLIRNYGKRYLSDKVNREYIEIVEEIADTFRVSKTAAEIRLKQLGFIQKEQRYAFSY